jgi:hypothetical protein
MNVISMSDTFDKISYKSQLTDIIYWTYRNGNKTIKYKGKIYNDSLEWSNDIANDEFLVIKSYIVKNK